MPWIYLAIAGVLEIIWAFSMKQADGFTKLVPSLITAVTMLGSIGFLVMAMKTLPLGTAYAIWTGIGAVGAFAIGVMVLGEALTPLRLISAMLIVAGLIGLKLASD